MPRRRKGSPPPSWEPNSISSATSYSARFPDAYIFQEVCESLFRVMDEGKCAVCGIATFFLDYTRKERPNYICSAACYKQWAIISFGTTNPEET